MGEVLAVGKARALMARADELLSRWSLMSDRDGDQAREILTEYESLVAMLGHPESPIKES